MGLNIDLIGVCHTRVDVSEYEAWLRSRCGEDLERLSVGTDEDGHTRIAVCFHPAAEDVEITLRADSVLVGARTTPAGPGYHLYVADLLQDMGRAFTVEWLQQTDEDDSPSSDDTDYFFTGDRRLPSKHFDGWLGKIAEIVMEEVDKGNLEGMQIGMPLNCGFALLDVVNTPLGPRSVDWLKRTAMDPAAGHDFFAWLNDVKDAEYFRRRALAHLWNDVHWCRPFCEKEERLLRRVDRLLRNAWSANSRADLPWREWQEVRQLAGISGKEDAVIRTNGADVDPAIPLIGYRRYEVRHQLPGGWSIKLPGSFIDSWEEDCWSASDGHRTIHVTTFSFTQKGSMPTAREILGDKEDSPQWPLQHADGEVVGRAHFAYDPDEQCWNFHGISAVDGKMAVLTVSVPTAADQTWAGGIWRSLSSSS